MTDVNGVKQTEIDLEAEKAKIDSLLISDSLKAKMKSLLLAELSFSSDSVEIGGKKFSVLKPAVNNKDVFSGPEGYEHVTYIKGTALTREVQNAGKKLFNSIEEAKAFLTEHVPGKTDDERIQNFSHMLGLEKSGYRHPKGGWYDQGERGYAWLTKPDDVKAGYLVFSGDEAYIYWGSLDFLFPVVCFQD